MNTKKSNLAGFTGLLLALVASSSSRAEIIVIDSFTRNGSFEDGALSPWHTSQLSVMHDPDFANHGDQFGVIDSIAFSPLVGQILTPDPSQGLTFLLTFDARAGMPGYTFVSTTMGARTTEGISLNAIVTPIQAPSLSSDAWKAFEYVLEMPDVWSSSGITFRISFSKNIPLDGVSHFAYIDNVVLRQIPEPAAWGLFVGVLCAACVAVRRPRRSRQI